MSILEIVEYPNDVLTIPTINLTAEEASSEETQTLIFDMIETCEDAGGAGLAANQVGISKSICVINMGKEGYAVLINPAISKAEGMQHWKGEGCLSLPGKYYNIKRPKKVTVEFMSTQGELGQFRTYSKFTAQRICHEIDHLNGITLEQKGKRAG